MREVRDAGARIKLIPDGDVAGGLNTCFPDTGVDVLMGVGGAPEGVITAARAVEIKVPLVVRLQGTNVELGRKMLAESGLPIITADTMSEAAERVVAAAKKAGTLAADETWTVTLPSTQPLTGGTFTLSLGSHTTGKIAFNATGAIVQT